MIRDPSYAQYRHILRNDLCGFIHRSFRELNPQTEFQMNWHIELMVQKLIDCMEGRIPANKDPALIKALVRAHKWEKALTARQEKSLGTISKNEDLQIKYVTQIYRLNFLAPKIKEAIIDGNQPQGLTLSRLMRDIPLCWKEQERLYGF